MSEPARATQSKEPKPAVGVIDDPETRRQMEQMELIAEWMDRRYLDPLLGMFLPGGGDTLGSLVGLYGVYVAAKMRVSPVILARMLINLAIDALIGSVPILGWIGDFFYRAHVKNLELLKDRGAGAEATGGDWFIVLLAFALFLFAAFLPLILIGLVIYFALSLG